MKDTIYKILRAQLRGESERKDNKWYLRSVLPYKDFDEIAEEDEVVDE